jgi:hypothetical protein
VVTERFRVDVEAHVWKRREEFTVRLSDCIMTTGDLAGQFGSCRAGSKCGKRRRNVVLVLGLEMSKNRCFAHLPNVGFGCLGHLAPPSIATRA